jgi:hypothetical protein
MTDNALSAYGQLAAPDQWESGEINRALLEELAYKELFTSNAERSGPGYAPTRTASLHDHRGLTPLQRLVNNVDGNHD